MTDLEILQLHFSGIKVRDIADRCGVTKRAVLARIERLRDPVGVRLKERKYYMNAKVRRLLG